MSFFYLSFVNDSLPKGQRFVGATIVEGDSAPVAFERAKELGLVPTQCETKAIHLWTQVEPQEEIVRADQLPIETREWLNRLVTAAEVKTYQHRPVRESEGDYICKDHAP